MLTYALQALARESFLAEYGVEEGLGTQFTCFTGAKVQILTQLRA